MRKSESSTVEYNSSRSIYVLCKVCGARRVGYLSVYRLKTFRSFKWNLKVLVSGKSGEVWKKNIVTQFNPFEVQLILHIPPALTYILKSAYIHCCYLGLESENLSYRITYTSSLFTRKWHGVLKSRRLEQCFEACCPPFYSSRFANFTY
jgi:hypothetical protein